MLVPYCLVAQWLVSVWSSPLGAPARYSPALSQTHGEIEAVPVIHLPINDNTGKASIDQYLHMFPQELLQSNRRIQPIAVKKIEHEDFIDYEIEFIELSEEEYSDEDSDSDNKSLSRTEDKSDSRVRLKPSQDNNSKENGSDSVNITTFMDLLRRARIKHQGQMKEDLEKRQRRRIRLKQSKVFGANEPEGNLVQRGRKKIKLNTSTHNSPKPVSQRREGTRKNSGRGNLMETSRASNKNNSGRKLSTDISLNNNLPHRNRKRVPFQKKRIGEKRINKLPNPSKHVTHDLRSTQNTVRGISTTITTNTNKQNNHSIRRQHRRKNRGPIRNTQRLRTLTTGSNVKNITYPYFMMLNSTQSRNSTKSPLDISISRFVKNSNSNRRLTVFAEFEPKETSTKDLSLTTNIFKWFNTPFDTKRVFTTSTTTTAVYTSTIGNIAHTQYRRLFSTQITTTTKIRSATKITVPMYKTSKTSMKTSTQYVASPTTTITDTTTMGTTSTSKNTTTSTTTNMTTTTSTTTTTTPTTTTNTTPSTTTTTTTTTTITTSTTITTTTTTITTITTSKKTTPITTNITTNTTTTTRRTTMASTTQTTLKTSTKTYTTTSTIKYTKHQNGDSNKSIKSTGSLLTSQEKEIQIKDKLPHRVTNVFVPTKVVNIPVKSSNKPTRNNDELTNPSFLIRTIETSTVGQIFNVEKTTSSSRFTPFPIAELGLLNKEVPNKNDLGRNLFLNSNSHLLANAHSSTTEMYKMPKQSVKPVTPPTLPSSLIAILMRGLPKSSPLIIEPKTDNPSFMNLEGSNINKNTKILTTKIYSSENFENFNINSESKVNVFDNIKSFDDIEEDHLEHHGYSLLNIEVSTSISADEPQLTVNKNIFVNPSGEKALKEKSNKGELSTIDNLNKENILNKNIEDFYVENTTIKHSKEESDKPQEKNYAHVDKSLQTPNYMDDDSSEARFLEHSDKISVTTNIPEVNGKTEKTLTNKKTLLFMPVSYKENVYTVTPLYVTTPSTTVSSTDTWMDYYDMYATEKSNTPLDDLYSGQYHEVNPGQYHEVNPGQYGEIHPGQYNDFHQGQYQPIQNGHYQNFENSVSKDYQVNDVKVDFDQQEQHNIYTVEAKAGDFIIGEVGKIDINNGQTLEGVRYTALDGQVDSMRISDIIERFFGTRTNS